MIFIYQSKIFNPSCNNILIQFVFTYEYWRQTLFSYLTLFVSLKNKTTAVISRNTIPFRSTCVPLVNSGVWVAQSSDSRVELRTFVLVHLVSVLSVLLCLRILITPLIFLCSSCLFVIFCLLTIVLSVLRMYGAVMAVIVWWLDLQIPNESVPITIVVMSSNLVWGQGVQLYVVKFVCDLRQVGGCLVSFGFLHQ